MDVTHAVRPTRAYTGRANNRKRMNPTIAVPARSIVWDWSNRYSLCDILAHPTLRPAEVGDGATNTPTRGVV